jgi:predicted ester cyclase
MSTSSVISALLAAGDADDVEAFDRYLHDDVVVHAPAGLSTVGLEAERESWRRAKAAMPNLNHEVLEVFTGPSGEAARVVVTGTMSGSYGGFTAEARPFTVDQAVIVHLRDGKIAELWEILDTAVLSLQLGKPHVRGARE